MMNTCIELRDTSPILALVVAEEDPKAGKKAADHKIAAAIRFSSAKVCKAQCFLHNSMSKITPHTFTSLGPYSLIHSFVYILSLFTRDRISIIESQNCDSIFSSISLKKRFFFFF